LWKKSKEEGRKEGGRKEGGRKGREEVKEEKCWEVDSQVEL
jgi:hypothetical protein